MKLTSATATPIVVALFVAALALLVGGAFFSVLLLPACMVALVAAIIAVQAKPTTMLVAAWLFVCLSGVGFISMTVLWGKLDYGVVLYIVVWGPFISAGIAMALFIAYFFSR